jgi:sodium-dependent dicarboxylate transporter 2/3/5
MAEESLLPPSGAAAGPGGESPPLVARVGLVLGPLAALAVFWLLPAGDGGLSHAARACGGVATLMAVWWMTEALPLEATALLPLVLLPLTGVYSAQLHVGDLVQVKSLKASGRIAALDSEAATVVFRTPRGEIAERYPRSDLTKPTPFARAAAPFADPPIFLFLGGFLIALAIERWGLHRRLALLTLLAVGTSPPRLIGGFMLATALVSMWISNTATTAMMLPIGLSVVQLLSSRLAEAGRGTGREAAGAEWAAGDGGEARQFATCLLLGIAYAASLGGFGTLVGTPPNVFFKGFLRERGVEIDFGRWMLFATPLAMLYLLLAWLLMTRVLFRMKLHEIPGGRELIRRELARLGPLSRGEWIVLGVFLTTAALWISCEWLKNWAWLVERVPLVRALDDYLIAMLGALALFVLPVDPARHRFALDWQTALRLPWGVLLLFGGGLSLAAALSDSGLAEWIGRQAAGLRSLPTLVQIVLVVAVIVFSGELTNNLAAVVAILPILYQVAVGMQLDPLLLCVPAVVAASCGFMLPVATPPNAIVFGTGHIRLAQMMRAGFWLDVLAVVLVPLFTYLAAGAVLGVRT